MAGSPYLKLAQWLFVWMLKNVDGFMEYVWFYMDNLKRRVILKREGKEEDEDSK
jgi:hypothetical protein